MALNLRAQRSWDRLNEWHARRHQFHVIEGEIPTDLDNRVRNALRAYQEYANARLESADSELEARLIALDNEILGTTNSSPEAVWLGDGRVTVGSQSFTLEPQLSDVLQSLVELRTATKPQLQEHSGRDEPDKLLKRLVERYPALAPYVRRPGGRGKGGYSTTIVIAPK